MTVILCHMQQRFTLLPISVPGLDGVELFFVLSGFLITTLLLREHSTSGTIAVRTFYFRRATRILPPFFLYLGIVVLICKLTDLVIPRSAILSAGLFTGGLAARNGSFFTEHLWSLGVEEQFYLLWPLLLIWAFRKGGRRLAVRSALFCIALSPVFRILITFVHLPMLAHKQGMILPGRMDSLFAGCTIALCLGSGSFEHLYHRLSKVWWTAPIFFFALSPMLRAEFGNLYTFTVGYTLESLTMAYFIVWVTRTPKSLVGRALDWKPMRLLGTMSYSMYLYQSMIIHDWAGVSWNQHPLYVAAAVLVVGASSFYLVEVPLAWFRKSRAPEVPAPRKAGELVAAA